MVEVKKYHLRPTALIPNSPLPLLHYPGLLDQQLTSPSPAVSLYNLYTSNSWSPQWIFRYGPTQRAHYHSRAHEAMAVLSGTATIRFGVADTSPDLDASTSGDAHESGGVEIAAKAGDVFIIPAGVAHKTHDTTPAEFALLSPGDGHGIAEAEKGKLEGLELEGFVMMGAYPKGAAEWDFAIGGESDGKYESVWSVPVPGRDPVLGEDEEGVRGLWKRE
ncbi:hypothetical protein K461DRAFT_225339 [Myriangium duriaei CBS 260.36]|uniref:Cupin type-1 domain-containing protein n=1 Tax=Myriangium duriaei CBS 260.36 TaxID=1168546 RepID=A0A9P4MK94_9PEZI|nr:hypothetical protein K461DRAFT_225339 [Myriangium duriaei CBS 260.36]